MKSRSLIWSVVAVVLAAAGLLLAARLGGVRTVERLWSADKTAVAPAAAVPPSVPSPVDVPILVYHNIRPTPPRKLSALDAQYEVTPEEFRAQLAYLKDNGFTAVSFAALAARLADGTAPWPAKPVIISFDDGRREQLKYAVPLLDEAGIKATFFIFTNAPDRNDKYFTWDEIKQLEAAGHEIGSHTLLHQYLTKVDDARLASELGGAQADFEKHLGHRVAALAYPFGLTDERVRAAAAAAGHTMARALHHEVTVKPGQELDLPGYIITGNLERFKNIVAGGSVGK
jgi:peptidoglycan/xylan/chitin deacetylase (PgdA/CDA1 family)